MFMHEKFAVDGGPFEILRGRETIPENPRCGSVIHGNSGNGRQWLFRMFGLCKLLNGIEGRLYDRGG